MHYNRLLALCRRHGVEIIPTGCGCIDLAAPAGQLFKCSGAHCAVSPCGHCADEPDATRSEQVASAVDDILAGFEPCVDIDCDVCENK